MQTPEKLSEFVRLAVNDAKSLVASGVKLDMSHFVGFVSNNGPGVCSVCLGGAVLVCQRPSLTDDSSFRYIIDKLGGPKSPQWFDRHIWALDSVRAGNLKTAIKEFYGSDIMIEFPELSFYTGPIEHVDVFFEAMEERANLLESKGF